MNWFLSLFVKKNRESEALAVFNTDFIKESPALLADYASSENWPDWLSDEQSLRDEAVVFGFANAALEDKLNSIEAYYQQNSIFFQKKLGQFDEKILELNLEQEAKNTAIKNLESRQKEILETDFKQSHVLRFLLGLIICVAMCVGNYFLIAEWLQSTFKNNAQWIAWGIFLTGMFNLFAPISFLHENQKPTWRQLLEGIGVPFAAAFLVCILTYEQYGLPKSTGIFLFLFLTFIFTGKLLLGNIINLVSQYKIMVANIKLQINKKLADTTWKAEIQKLEKDIANLRADKWKIKPDLDQVNAELQKLSAEKNAALNMFKSEFELAARYAREYNTQRLNLK